MPTPRRSVTGNHNGFVLLKHLIQEKDAGGRDQKAPYPIYSLYMHLAYPAWSGERTDPYADVPWVRRLLQARNGAMVDLRPDQPTFGEILWVKTQGMEKDARPCVVYKPGSMDPMPFPLRSGERLNGVFKNSPAELRRGYEGLKDGHIITFHLPYLFVAQGEIIGRVDRVSNPVSPPAFLHWEIFSPAGAQSGIRKLVALQPGLGIKDVADGSEDNFLDEADFKNLLKPLAKEERDLIQSILDEHHEGYAKQVFEERAKHNETFSAPRTVDVADPPKEPFYVVALEVARKSAHCAVEPGTSHLDLQFRGEDEKLLAWRASVPVQFGSADSTTVHVPVPATAARMVVSSSDVFVDAALGPPPAAGADRVAEDLKLLREDLIDHRWRNVVLEHVTEWSQAGLTRLFRDHPAAVRPFTLEKVLPITWWGRTSGDFGEVPVLGDGSSIFSKDILPKDGKIHNLHPVTALWLLHALLDHGKIAFAAEPARFEGLQNPEVLYRGWTVETAKVGDPLFAVAIRKDFDSTDSAVFTAKGPDEELALGSAQYAEGVAKLALRASFWGKWELKVPSTPPAQRTAHDDVAQWWKDLSGGSPGPTLIEVKAPKLASVDMPERLPGSASYSIRLQFADDCPKAMHGLVFFKCARVAASATGKPQGDPPPAPAADAFVLCAKAVVVSGSKVEVELKGLSYETAGGYRFITGTDRGRATPLASPHLPLKAYQDAWKHKDEKFRLSVELARRVERLFSLWDRRATLQVSRRQLLPAAVASDGLSVTLTPAFRFAGAPGEKAHAQAAEFDALVAEARELEKHPWEPTRVVSADAASRQLTLAVEHPQPRPDAGDLVAQFDPGPLVDDFVRAAGGKDGDRIFVSAGFYGPNGGEHAISAYPHETAEIVELSGDVQDRIAKGERGVVAQPAGSAALLTFDHVAFAGTGSAMARDGIEIFAVGGGLAAMWEKIHVEVKNGGARFPCARTGTRGFGRAEEEGSARARGGRQRVGAVRRPGRPGHRRSATARRRRPCR